MARQKKQVMKIRIDLIRPHLMGLTDEEKGQLFSSMMAYVADGEAPHLRGNTALVWPLVKMQIDTMR